jgi:sucrose-6-phosphate hydrolase SacC (GH32 family)
MTNRLLLSFGIGAVALSSLAITKISNAQAAGSNDIMIADFEGPTYGDWKATGTAFKQGPVSADLARKLELENFHGNGVVTTKVDGDGPTGALTSPTFTVQRHFTSFLIAGGIWEHETCLNLLLDGQVVHSATGGNNIHLEPVSWDVSKLMGKTVQLQIVDQASGDWGHIDVDDILQTDKPERLPVVTQPLYLETLRPQAHFTARQWTIDRLNPQQRQEGWLNDLNGLIYYDGEYHLFAQRWAKCWIHAVSKDLVHWTELQPAFWEEHEGSGVQSGHCVVDYNNTSGLSPDKANPPMVAFWSRFDQHSQCMSYSLDHGRTWKLYEKNPLFEHPERDPKVFWYEPGKHWVMIMYGDRKYHILTSPNLLDWKDEHNPIPNCYECPDFFQLPVDGKADNKRWVLIQGNGNYSTGNFNGIQYTDESDRLACDIGPNFYATQTWANTETGDGRRIQAAWMRCDGYPNMPFNQEVSFPCEFTLHTTPKGLRLFREPIKELALLHQTADTWTDRVLNDGAHLTLEPSGDVYEIQCEVSIPAKAKLTFDLLGAQVVLTSDTIHSGPAHGSLQEPIKTVQILVDRVSIETFLNHGEISSTRSILPMRSGLSATSSGGPIEIRSLKVFPLKSAWGTE